MPTKRTIYIGVDPGKSGGVAALAANNAIESYHTPAITTRKKKRGKSAGGKTRYSSKTDYDLPGMLRILKRYADLQNRFEVIVVIEQQRQMPRDSKQVVFQVGYGMGLWDMACAALGLTNVVKVLPSQWKPNYVEKGAPKKDSVLMCKLLYPKHELPLAKDEARAEAVLIADYQRRKDTGVKYPRNKDAKETGLHDKP